MIILRIAVLIGALAVCAMYSFHLGAKFLLVGCALTLANSGLHGKSSGTIDTFGGILCWIGIVIFIYSAVMH